MADITIINSPVKIIFDNQGHPETPTLILAKRNGDKLGVLNAKEIDYKETLNDSSEINFRVYKYIDDNKDEMWDDIRNFRLVWWKEQDLWFEIRVDVDEGLETTKTVYGVQLGKAELSEIELYNIEINTEDDIAREDYEIPTTLYNEEHPEASLLNRIMEKAPHYSIKHVDESIKDIQRTFTFDNTSIYEALGRIGEEIGCLFVFSTDDIKQAIVGTSQIGRATVGSGGSSSTRITRQISVYDLYDYCNECGHREENMDVCPECGGSDIRPGYGEDTTIFVTADELAQNIGLSSDTDSIKNCYRVEGEDDLMTATVRNANPNGTEYIWYFSDEMLEDVSPALRTKLLAYNELYSEWFNGDTGQRVTLDYDLVSNYNLLIEKYSEYDEDLEYVDRVLIGYPALMKILYDTLDFDLYLSSALMPSVSMEETTAVEQLNNIESLITYIAVTNTASVAAETASNAYKQLAKALLDYHYDLKIVSSEITISQGQKYWTGVISITNISDGEDMVTSGELSIPITDEYEEFTRQKIDKIINKTKVSDMSVSALFAMSLSDFREELKKYCIDSLSSFENLCQSVIDIIVEQGLAAGGTWAAGNSIYDDLYVPYRSKMSAIETEIAIRSGEIKKINALHDAVLDISDAINTGLNIKELLGDELWEEFSTYRREYKYSDSNYSSEGLGNKELFERAMELISSARADIDRKYKSQYSINTTLNNLLHIPKFAPITNHFSIGNWMRIQVDDRIYKLRLIEYTINFEDISQISVTFSQTALMKNNSVGILKSLQQSVEQSTQREINKQAIATNIEMMNINNVINGLLDDINRGAIDGAPGLPGADGESSFYVMIESSAGNIFKNQGINTILTAHAYYGSTEVTDYVSHWRWEKHNSDGTTDPDWNRATAGNTIVLSPSDVQSRAVFYAYAEFTP